MQSPEVDGKYSIELPSEASQLAWQLSTAHLSMGVSVNSDMLAAFAAATAPNTLRSLKADCEAFDLWCRRNNKRSFPAAPSSVANWLRERGNAGAAPASLARYKASLAKLHRLLSLDDPTRDELVRLTLAGHRRRIGTAQRQAAPLRFNGPVRNPLMDGPRGINVKALLEACDITPVGLRNRAMLSVAYDTGLRAGELVQLRIDDIVPALVQDAALAQIRRHKGDQEAEGSTAYLSPRSVRAIDAWKIAAEITEGPIFRRIIVRRYAAKPGRPKRNIKDISGRAIWNSQRFVARDAVGSRIEYHIGDKSLHSGSVTPIIRATIANAIGKGVFVGIEADTAELTVAKFSSHSTRVGLNQDLFCVGETLAGSMDALRWKSPKMPLLYNRNLEAEYGAAARFLNQL